MIVSQPTVSLKSFQHLYPELNDHAQDLVDSGYWFYCIRQKSFVSYLPSLGVSVQATAKNIHPIDSETVNFNLHKYSSLYEVTTEDGTFPSSLLLAPNLEEIVGKFLDINDSLMVMVLDNQMSPIFLGAKQVMQRLIMPAAVDSYRLFNLSDFTTKAGGN